MILIDTHVPLWHEQGDHRLGSQARQVFELALQEGDAAISAISFWEVGMRMQKGHFYLPFDLDAWRRDVLDHGLVEIPIDGAIAARAGLLSEMHGDPADRLIMATALAGHRLMTADQRILGWPGRMSRLDAAK
ncbi:MAG: type II toxin-antitoxin system VapC family toxin [Dehalococcoidia bacterium]|nr:type II toxin-antitoxin system VapC family toxin [Dehalococcoidia bacterium]